MKVLFLPWRIYFNLDYSDLLDDSYSTVHSKIYVIFGNADNIHL